MRLLVFLGLVPSITAQAQHYTSPSSPVGAAIAVFFGTYFLVSIFVHGYVRRKDKHRQEEAHRPGVGHVTTSADIPTEAAETDEALAARAITALGAAQDAAKRVRRSVNVASNLCHTSSCNHSTRPTCSQSSQQDKETRCKREFQTGAGMPRHRVPR